MIVILFFFVEVDLRYPDSIKEITKNFSSCLENKVFHKDNYNDYVNKMKPKNYTKTKTLLRDWTDKKNCLIQYRMLEFYVRHGTVIEKIMK